MRSMYKYNAKVPKNEGRNNSFLYYAATIWNMLPPDLKVIAFKGRMEFADQADQYLTEKELFLRQEKYKKQEALRFKGQIKKWITLNIPQE